MYRVDVIDRVSVFLFRQTGLGGRAIHQKRDALSPDENAAGRRKLGSLRLYFVKWPLAASSSKYSFVTAIGVVT